jgi:hypothetical protein
MVDGATMTEPRLPKELEERCKKLVIRWEKGGLKGRHSVDGDIILDLSPDDDDEEACYITLWEWLFSFVEREIAQALTTQREEIAREVEELYSKEKNMPYFIFGESNHVKIASIGYKKAIDGVLQLLKEKGKE